MKDYFAEEIEAKDYFAEEIEEALKEEEKPRFRIREHAPLVEALRDLIKSEPEQIKRPPFGELQPAEAVSTRVALGEFVEPRTAELRAQRPSVPSIMRAATPEEAEEQKRQRLEEGLGFKAAPRKPAPGEKFQAGVQETWGGLQETLMPGEGTLANIAKSIGRLGVGMVEFPAMIGKSFSDALERGKTPKESAQIFMEPLGEQAGAMADELSNLMWLVGYSVNPITYGTKEDKNKQKQEYEERLDRFLKDPATPIFSAWMLKVLPSQGTAALRKGKGKIRELATYARQKKAGKPAKKPKVEKEPKGYRFERTLTIPELGAKATVGKIRKGLVDLTDITKTELAETVVRAERIEKGVAERPAKPIVEKPVVPRAKPTTKPVAKQPWEMTRDEHTLLAQPSSWDPRLRYRVPYEETKPFNTRKQAIKWLDVEHKRQIRQALSEGKPVPKEVLAEYPKLKSVTEKPAEKLYAETPGAMGGQAPEQRFGRVFEREGAGVAPTAEPAELPKYAGSINLTKLSIGDDVKRSLVKIAEVKPKKKISWKETERMFEQAENMGFDKDNLHAYADVVGQGKMTMMLEGARQWNTKAIQSLKEVQASITPEQWQANPKLRMKLIDSFMGYADGLFESHNTLASEAGRSLGSLRKTVGSRAYRENLRKVLQDVKGAAHSEFADILYKLDLENPLEVAKVALSLHKPQLIEYMRSWWFNNVLSSPTTHLINQTSNLAHFSVQYPLRFLRGAWDAPISKLQGRPREFFMSEAIPSLDASLKGIKTGTAKAFRMMRDGYMEEDLSKFTYEMSGKKNPFEFSSSKTVRKLAPILTISGRALSAGDLFWKGIAFETEMNVLSWRSARKQFIAGGKKLSMNELIKLKEEIRANPTPDMIRQGSEFARYVTYTDAPGAFTKKILALREVIPRGGGHFIIPFVNTIGKLTLRGSEFTPGLGALHFLKAKGPKVSELLAKQTLGAMAGTYFAIKAMQGELTGAPPKSRAERQAMYRTGKKPFAVKMGDNWVEYRRFEPFNIPITTIAVLFDDFKKSKKLPLLSKVMKVQLSIAKNLLDQSYVKTLGDLITAIERGGETTRTLEKFPSRILTGFIPFSSLQRSLIRATEAAATGEAKVRRPVGLIESFKATSPLTVGTIRTEKDVWGKPATFEGGPIRQYLPYKWSKESDDPLERELAKVGYFPSMPAEYVTRNGKRIDLTEDERDKLITLAGRNSERELRMLIRTPAYLNERDPDERAQMMRNRIRKERKRVMDTIIWPMIERRMGSKLRLLELGITP